MSDHILHRDSNNQVVQEITPSNQTASIHLMGGEAGSLEIPIEGKQYRLDIKYISNIQNKPDRNQVFVSLKAYPMPERIKKINPETLVVKAGSKIFFTPVRNDIDTDILVFVSLYKTDGVAQSFPGDSSVYWIECVPTYLNLQLNDITQPVKSYAHFSDGSIIDITSLCTWLSDNTGIATVNLNVDKAIVTPIDEGNTLVRASFIYESQVYTQTCSISVSAPTSLTFIPASITTSVIGTKHNIKAIFNFYDSSTLDITTSPKSTWTVDNHRIATISVNSVTGYAEVTIVGAGHGHGNITYDFTALHHWSTSFDIIVTPAVVTSVTINPETVDTYKGLKQQMRAIALFSDGETQDVTNLGTWYIEDTTIAIIDNLGLVTAQNVGSTHIGFIYATTPVQSVPINVNAAVVISGYITPSAITLVTEEIVDSLESIAVYSDGSKSEITPDGWQSSDISKVTVSNNGIVQAISSGTALITFKKYSEYQKKDIISDPCNVSVVNIYNPNEFDNYLKNGQFTAYNTNIIPNKLYSCLKYPFYILGDPYNYWESPYGSIITYISNTRTPNGIDYLRLTPISNTDIATNVSNCSHKLNYIINNTLDGIITLEYKTGDVLTLAAKPIVFSFDGCSSKNNTQVEVFAKQYITSAVINETSLGIVYLSPTSNKHHINAVVPIPDIDSCPDGADKDNYFSIIMRISNYSGNSDTNIIIENLQLNQTTAILNYKYVPLDEINVYRNAIFMPALDSTSELYLRNYYPFEIEGNALTIVRSPDNNCRGMVSLRYKPPVPTGTIILMPSYPTGWFPNIPVQEGWLACQSQSIADGINAIYKTNYSKTKYQRLYNYLMSNALFTAIPKMMSQSYNLTVTSEIINNLHCVKCQPYTNSPQGWGVGGWLANFIVFDSALYSSAVFPGTWQDIERTNKQGYLTYTIPANGYNEVKYYFIFIPEETGEIIYPDGVIERENVVFVPYKQGDGNEEITTSIFNAMNPIAFSLAITPSSLYEGFQAQLIKT